MPERLDAAQLGGRERPVPGGASAASSDSRRKIPIRLVVAAGARARRWVRYAFREDSRFAVVAEAGDAPDAVATALRTVPDLCLLDVRTPGGGIAAAWEISSRLPRTKVVMLADTADSRDFFASLRAGASSYLLRPMNPARLAPALLDVFRGTPAIPRSLVALLVEEYRYPGPRRRSVASPVPGPDLTTREWQVLDLLHKNLTTDEMARRLGVSRATVRSHLSTALRKLGIADRETAIRHFGSR